MALIFDHFGPYHLSRLNASSKLLEVTGIELFSRSSDYAWIRSEFSSSNLTTLWNEHSLGGGKVANAKMGAKLRKTLKELRPQVVAIPGWSASASRQALAWCIHNQVPAILMSESSLHDERRIWYKEWIKQLIVACFSSALVGGSKHREYLLSLGMSATQISLGYDSVDNNFFRKGSAECRKSQQQFRPNSFLASARFIEKKNLFALLDAYKSYRTAESVARPNSDLWTLTILGDGPLRRSLEDHVKRLDLGPFVSMPGFLQYQELPLQYSKASAFVHASTTEQWGLVVNEAMACGLPVLVSNRCGCASDLVSNGVNGFTFDPFSIDSIANKLIKISRLSAIDLDTMGKRSAEIIKDWGPERFAQGMLASARTAMAMGYRTANTLTRLAMRMLLVR